MFNKEILNKAEYTSLGISTLGTILAAATGQIAYAASPLTFTLFINLINRNRLAQDLQGLIHVKTANNETISKQQLEQQLSNLSQSIIDDIFKKNEIYLDNALSFEKKNAEKKSKESFQEIEQKIDRSIESYKNSLDDYLKNFFVSQKQLEESISKLNSDSYNAIDNFGLFVKDNRPQYELVYDRRGSRRVLLKALTEAQNRIILVCPWITYYGADSEVIELCKAFLERGGSIDIGWGHLKDIKQTRHLSINRSQFLRIVDENNKSWIYNQIEKFIELENKYEKCNLKLLGTHEKFLVCDRSFAMIGSHNFLTSNCHSSEREIGLMTNDKNIIEELIERFESKSNLDTSECWNAQISA